MNQKSLDSEHLKKFLEIMFIELNGRMYFEEFKKLSEECTSELFVSIFDCIYNFVPCVKNFMVMRANFH